MAVISTPFTGFSPATMQFFKDLSENNNKPWFDEHKAVYQSVLQEPLKALVTAMTPAMYAIDANIDFRPGRVLSRIYRDVRFSHDKSPYKTAMWMTFQRVVEKWENFPAFFMEISAGGPYSITNPGGGYAYGMGLYGSDKKVMDSFRSQIEYEQKHFEEMTKDLITKHGFQLGGEEYKRPVKNDLPDYFQPWVQRKSVYLIKNCPVGEEMFDAGFATLLSNEFMLMKPFYEFMVEASSL